MDIQQAFGRAVKLRRTELGLNQEGLADGAGKARSFISAVERGAVSASLTSMWDLAVALGTTPSEIWAKAEGIYYSSKALPPA
tara:strand:+ start:321 stop:569 length:249 start_codon:yes stop_codon:yes gene_type:complete